jgi:hypothetical protein
MPRIYHITHIDNLESIISHGCLWCDRISLERSLTSRSIAHQNIKDRRTCRDVPIASKGTLADYVPFYFAPRSPMLYVIHKRGVKGYRGGQREVLYLVTTAERIQSAGLSFTFTDGHAEIRYSRFFDNLADLEQCIDWEIMNARYWRDTPQDGDRERRRQAEFLVHQQVPWSLIFGIGVIDEYVARRVESILESAQHRPRVRTKKDWYY